MAAHAFPGAVAEVLLGEIAEPGWKPVDNQHLCSLKVAPLAPNGSRVCTLTPSEGPFQEPVRGAQVVATAGLPGADAARPRSGAFVDHGQLLPARTHLSLKRFLFSNTRTRRAGEKRRQGPGSRPD